ESVSLRGLARGRGWRCYAAKVRKGGLGAKARWVVADGGEERPSHVRINADEATERWRRLHRQAAQFDIERHDLLAEQLMAQRQALQHKFRCRHRRRDGAWAQANRNIDELITRQWPQPLAQLRRRGDQEGVHLVRGLG